MENKIYVNEIRVVNKVELIDYINSCKKGYLKLAIICLGILIISILALGKGII